MQFGTCGLIVNERNKGEEFSFMELGEAAIKKELIGGNWNFDGDFLLAELWYHSLAELLLGKKESFLSPAEVVK